jgi:hypothetical protein
VSSTAPRADRARQVLDWCRYGHQKMRSNPTGPDWVQDWALTWTGTIALLRAVGHELVNEDAKRDARLEKALGGWWAKLKITKPNPSIFWQFIERDRNLLLKEAELNVGHPVKDGSPITVRGNLSRRRGSQQPQPEHESPPPGAALIFTYQMTSGFFVGQDPRKLVGEAIEWWEKQLDDIEQKAAASSP